MTTEIVNNSTNVGLLWKSHLDTGTIDIDDDYSSRLSFDTQSKPLPDDDDLNNQDLYYAFDEGLQYVFNADLYYEMRNISHKLPGGQTVWTSKNTFSGPVEFTFSMTSAGIDHVFIGFQQIGYPVSVSTDPAIPFPESFSGFSVYSGGGIVDGTSVANGRFVGSNNINFIDGTDVTIGVDKDGYLSINGIHEYNNPGTQISLDYDFQIAIFCDSWGSDIITTNLKRAIFLSPPVNIMTQNFYEHDIGTVDRPINTLYTKNIHYTDTGIATSNGTGVQGPPGPTGSIGPAGDDVVATYAAPNNFTPIAFPGDGNNPSYNPGSGFLGLNALNNTPSAGIYSTIDKLSTYVFVTSFKYSDNIFDNSNVHINTPGPPCVGNTSVTISVFDMFTTSSGQNNTMGKITGMMNDGTNFITLYKDGGSLPLTWSDFGLNTVVLVSGSLSYQMDFSGF